MNIGYFLKKIRTEKSLTLKEVAIKTKMTASLISQIENERIFPSLNSLEVILHYYGLEMSNFFEQVEKKSYVLTKHGSEPRGEPGSSAYIFALNPFLYELGPEWFFMEIPAGKRLEIKKFSEKKIEENNEMRFIFLIAGVITVEIGNGKIEMAVKDSLCFKSFLTVFMVNSNESNAKLILVGKQLKYKISTEA